MIPLIADDVLTRFSLVMWMIAKWKQVPDALHDVVELAPALKGATSTLILIRHVESVQTETLRVPVGDVGDVALVETGTVVVILLTFVYLMQTIVRASHAQRVSATQKDD
jgi:hypothetical protein